MVSVALFGAGPGLYVDLARLSFQVPTLLSAAEATMVKANIATRRLVEMKKSLLRMFLAPLWWDYTAQGGGEGPAFFGVVILDAGDVEEGGGKRVAEEDAEDNDDTQYDVVAGRRRGGARVRWG